VSKNNFKCPKMTNCHCTATTSCGRVMGRNAWRGKPL